MQLPAELYLQIKQHALESVPRECCGIIAVDREEQPVKVWCCSNVAADPRVGYRVDPEDQLFVLEEIMAHPGWAVGAVYHSHPLGKADPSREDVNLAYPGVTHLIIGMGEGLVTKAWRFNGGVHQEELVICE